MARKEADLKLCMVVQQLKPDLWEWNTNDKTAIIDKDIERIGKIVFNKLSNNNIDVNELYLINHNMDKKRKWDNVNCKPIEVTKEEHVHIVIKFEKGNTLKNIASAIGVEPQYIERAKKGANAYDNLLAYLIHAKDSDKYQYKCDDVIAIKGESYTEIYCERKLDWDKGKANKSTIRVKQSDINWLEDEILLGNVDMDAIMDDDRLFYIYAKGKRTIKTAFDTRLERVVYNEKKGFIDKKFHKLVFFVTGKSGSGKSYFTDMLANQIIDKVYEMTGQKWSCYSAASKNPVDDYKGEQILIMDDLRGSAMDSSNWLKLLDSDRIPIIAARFFNKLITSRIIIINAECSWINFFYFLEGRTPGESFDQYGRRIDFLIEVKRTDDNKRVCSVGKLVETDTYTFDCSTIGGRKEKMLTLNYGFDYTGLENIEYNQALTLLSDTVLSYSKLIDFSIEDYVANVIGGSLV